MAVLSSSSSPTHRPPVRRPFPLLVLRPRRSNQTPVATAAVAAATRFTRGSVYTRARGGRGVGEWPLRRDRRARGYAAPFLLHGPQTHGRPPARTANRLHWRFCVIILLLLLLLLLFGIGDSLCIFFFSTFVEPLVPTLCILYILWRYLFAISDKSACGVFADWTWKKFNIMFSRCTATCEYISVTAVAMQWMIIMCYYLFCSFGQFDLVLWQCWLGCLVG